MKILLQYGIVVIQNSDWYYSDPFISNPQIFLFYFRSDFYIDKSWFVSAFVHNHDYNTIAPDYN
jgi:hypothetical protein